jgi:hypothetical protein
MIKTGLALGIIFDLDSISFPHQIGRFNAAITFQRQDLFGFNGVACRVLYKYVIPRDIVYTTYYTPILKMQQLRFDLIPLNTICLARDFLYQSR